METTQENKTFECVIGKRARESSFEAKQIYRGIFQRSNERMSMNELLNSALFLKYRSNQVPTENFFFRMNNMLSKSTIISKIIRRMGNSVKLKLSTH
jgi:hypothetical protein